MTEQVEKSDSNHENFLVDIKIENVYLKPF